MFKLITFGLLISVCVALEMQRMQTFGQIEHFHYLGKELAISIPDDIKGGNVMITFPKVSVSKLFYETTAMIFF